MSWDGGAGGQNGSNGGGSTFGYGGIQTAGGTGGSPNGGAGSLGTGGNGDSSGSFRGGGGGAGGYYGGGGAGNGQGGGGGGSSWTSGISTTYTSNYQSGNGQIIISYVQNFGTYVSPAIQPVGVSYWGVLACTKTTPTNTILTVDVLSSSNNFLLQANIPSGTDLQATYPGTFTNITGIKLRGNFSTSDATQTPTLSDWWLEYGKGPVVTTSNWTSLAKKDRRVAQGHDVGWVSFQMKTMSGQARLRRMRIDKVTAGVTTPVTDEQAEISLWVESNNNGHRDEGDTRLSAKVKFTNGTVWLTMNNHIVDTTLRTYYIVARISTDAGGGTKLKLRVQDGSWLEFPDATCIGVPP